MAQRIDPARALLNPAFLGALALLAVNDHLLKGAGLLPGWLTGKLSDFAGLAVAPVVLAVLARARSVRAYTAGSIAIGIVFAAVKLHPLATDAWVRLMATVGFPWQVTRDPTDLVALPVLALAQWQFVRAARHAHPRPLRLLRASAWAFALLCCMATSPEDDGLSFTTHIHLVNATGRTLVVHVRPLRTTVAMDCEVMARDPARLFPNAAFGQALQYELGDRDTLDLGSVASGDGDADSTSWDESAFAFEFEAVRGCHAALLSGEGLDSTLLFWNEFEEYEIEGELPEGSAPRDGAVVLHRDGDGAVAAESVGGEYAFRPRPPPPLLRACATPGDGARLDWTEADSAAQYRLRDVHLGLDGCVRFRSGGVVVSMPLDAGTSSSGGADAGTDAGATCDADADAGTPCGDDPDAGVDDTGAGGTGAGGTGGASGTPGTVAGRGAWRYVCAPPGLFPFDEGEIVDIGVAEESLSMSPRLSTSGEGLYLERRAKADFVALGVALRAEPDLACGYEVVEGCAQVVRPLRVRAPGASETPWRAGEEHVPPRASDVRIVVAVAQERALVDTSCARGLPEVGADIEWAATKEGDGP
jgi:hypothetical protein